MHFVMILNPARDNFILSEWAVITVHEGEPCIVAVQANAWLPALFYGVPLDGLFAVLASTNTNGIVNGEDENFAIAKFSCPRCF